MGSSRRRTTTDPQRRGHEPHQPAETHRLYTIVVPWAGVPHADTAPRRMPLCDRVRAGAGLGAGARSRTRWRRRERETLPVTR